MTDLIHAPEEAQVVFNDDRHVCLTTTDGREMHTTFRDLLSDHFGEMELSVVTFSPDPEHVGFAPAQTEGDNDE